MRKIKSSERKNGMKYCSFCKPAKVSAVWRNTHLRCDRKDEKLQFACKDHKHLLKDGTMVYSDNKHEDDGYMTEADYQTWGRL